MPDRYWVGGTASWDGTAGTKWATTSGGAGGASVPTAADDVFFDAASGAGTVTIATGNTGAKSINCTGFTGTITGTIAITVSGSITLSASMTYTHTGTVTISNTGTLTTAGKTFSGLTINGAGGITVTLGDALNISTRTITVTQGTFTTNNFSVTAGLLSSTNTNTRTINLGSSTVILNDSGVALDFTTSTGLTFNAGTSQISLTGNGPTFRGGGMTFNNVSVTDTAQTTSITGANSFANLTLSSHGNASAFDLSFSNNQIITNLSVNSGSTAVSRIFIRSDTYGINRTLTVTTFSANNCDFRDITLAGAASPASPTNAGDCGGNSGIFFPAAKTVYRVGSSSIWGSTTGWASSSGGSGSVNNFPLTQDTAIINNSTTGSAITVNSYNFGNIDCSSRTTAYTLTTSSIDFYGSFKLSSSVTLSTSGGINFIGRGTMDIDFAGKSFGSGILTLNSLGGTLRLLSSLTSAGQFTLTQGTLDLNNFTLTCLSFVSSNSNTRTLAFGTGNVIVTGSSWNTGTTTNLTITGAAAISMTSASTKNFIGGGFSYSSLNNGGAGALTITGNNTFTTLSNSVQPTTFTFTAGTTTTVTNWNISGTAGNLVTIGSATAASHTLSKSSGTVSADFLSISRSSATGGATWYAGVNSTNGGNNSGWIFTAPPGEVGTGNFFSLFL